MMATLPHAVYSGYEPPDPLKLSRFKRKVLACCRAFFPIEPTLFEDWTEEEVQAYLMSVLPPHAQHAVNFSLSPHAVRLIFEHEVDIQRNAPGKYGEQLVVRKQAIDTTSWLATTGLEGLSLSLEEEDTLNRMVFGLKRVMDDYHIDLPFGPDALKSYEQHQMVTMADVKVFLALFATGFGKTSLQPIDSLEEKLGLWRFFNFMWVHVMNKTEAVKQLFGAQFAYSHLWQLKQTDLFRVLKGLQLGNAATAQTPLASRTFFAKYQKKLPVAMLR
ncbi:MAG: hypothetical protein KC474_00370 [Cyanobacteria bacterium HKST-UBA04]|nr:hypothetical protein [Cyanobacteria bacterium HKST-UBA04]